MKKIKTESRDKWSHMIYLIYSRDGLRFRSKLSNNSEIPIVAYPIYLHDGDKLVAFSMRWPLLLITTFQNFRLNLVKKNLNKVQKFVILDFGQNFV